MKKLLLFLTLGLASLAAQVIPQGSFVGGGQVTPASPSGGSATFSDIKVGDGTVGGPSFSYILDTDTGFYRRGSGDVGFSSNGTNTFSFPTSVGSSGQFLTTDGAGNITWGTGSGVLPSQTGNAGRLLTTDGTNASWADVTSAIVSRAPRQGIVSTGATFAGYTAANTSLAFGTNDLTIGMWVRMADWSPGSNLNLFCKRLSGNVPGYQLVLQSAGALQLTSFNGTTSQNFVSTAPVAAGDNEWVLLTVSVTLGGDIVYRINGVQLGSAVSAAALSGVSQTSASPLTWLSGLGAGGTDTAGTLGESFIAQGALTASQIANIAKNGTARGLGLTMYQHLVPSDSLAAGIFEDISGNANHAVLGTSGISTVIPIDLPADAPAQALVGDGSNGSRIYSTLNNQNPGTGDFALLWEGIYPQDASATARRLGVLTSSTTTTAQPGAFLLSYQTGTGLYVLAIAPASAGTRIMGSAPLHDMLTALGAAGNRAQLLVTRTSAGLTWYLGVGSSVFNVTNLFTETSTGSPPAWTDEIDGDYLVGYYLSATNSSTHTLHALELLNTAPTLADFEYRLRNGRWHPKFSGGNNAPITAVAGNGAAGRAFDTFSGAALDGFTAAVTATNSTDRTAGWTLPAFKAGDVIEASWSYTNNSGVTSASLRLATNKDSNTALSNLASSAAGANTATLTATGSGAALVFLTPGTAATNYTIASLVVKVNGVTTALDLQDGGGYQPKNPRSENGSTNWEMSTTGITWASLATAGKQISITKSYTHNEISTTAGTTLHGSLPAGWVVRETQVSVTATGDAGTTLNVGLAGTPAKYASAINIETMAFRRAESLSLVPESAVSVNGIYLQKNQATTQGAITVTVVIERIF